MKKGIVTTAIGLTIISILAKIVGILRDIVLADCYGAGDISDAYLIAISVPTLLFYFVGNALSASFIPMYTKVRTEKGEIEANKYSDRMMTFSILISTVIVVLILLFPEFIIKLFASGFDEAQVELAKSIIIISAATIYFMTAINIISSRLQIIGKYTIVALVSFPRNLCMIVSVILSTYYGLWWLGVGIVLAYLGELILLLPSLFKSKISFRLRFDFKDTYMSQTARMIFPIFISVSVSQVNKIIDRTIASNLTGGVSSLYYASMINTALQEILVASVVVIIFTNVSNLVANQKFEEVDEMLQKTLKTLRFILLPAMVGLIILAEPIVMVLFARGSFDVQAIKLTTASLRGYSVGICFLAAREVLIKVYYAYKRTKVTLIVSVIGILINIILNILLSSIWGVFGLAVATSISAICQYLILMIYYRKKIWKFNIMAYLKPFFKPVIGSIIMGTLVFLLDYFLLRGISSYIRLILNVLFGIGVYFIVEWILKSEEVRFIIDKLLAKRKINSQRKD